MRTNGAHRMDGKQLSLLPMYALEFAVEIIQISLQWNHILKVGSESVFNVKILHDDPWKTRERAESATAPRGYFS